MISKKEFRQQQLVKLTKFSQTEQKKAEDKCLQEAFIQSRAVSQAQKIGLTWAMPIEVATQPIIKALLAAGKEVYLPRCLSGHRMEFTRYNLDISLTQTKFGTFEDQRQQAIIDNNLDLLLVPGLAFNVTDHQRLGFGGGFYDRFLAKYPDISTLSLVNSVQQVTRAAWPTENFDQPIADLIISKERKL